MAAGGTPNNVQLGPGRLYVAPLGTAEPTTASAALPSAWRAIGYTEEGSNFTAEITNEGIAVAEEVDMIRYVMTARANSVVFAMAEMTRQNLGLAMNDATAAHAANGPTAYEPLDPGSEAAAMLVWDRDLGTVSGTNVRWLFRQAKAGGTVEIAARKAPAKSLIAVTFSLEKPSGTTAPWKCFPNPSGHVR